MVSLLQQENEAKSKLRETEDFIKRALLLPRSEDKIQILIELRRSYLEYSDILNRIQEGRLAEKKAKVAEEEVRLAEEAYEFQMAELSDAFISASRPLYTHREGQPSMVPTPPQCPKPRNKSPRNRRYT